MRRFLRRYPDLNLRIMLALLGLTLSVHSAGTLHLGEPSYRNFYNMLVSPHVALVIGLGLLLAAVDPWGWFRRRSKGSQVGTARTIHSAPALAPRVRADLPGRNDPCHCGSGVKYKKCCLGGDARQSLLDHRDRRAAALNMANGVNSATGMANRGLRGR